MEPDESPRKKKQKSVEPNSRLYGILGAAPLVKEEDNVF